jgi:hypothetical protein
VTANRVAVTPPPAVSAPNVPLTTITAPVRDPEPVASLPAAPSRAPIVAPAAEPVRETVRVRDDQLILRTLQQYRTAYESLDVSRAREVWPAVNQAALTRAFALRQLRRGLRG